MGRIDVPLGGQNAPFVSKLDALERPGEQRPVATQREKLFRPPGSTRRVEPVSGAAGEGAGDDGAINRRSPGFDSTLANVFDTTLTVRMTRVVTGRPVLFVE